MGTVVGAIASGQVPAGGDGDPTGSRTVFLPLVTGALFVLVAAYTAAVFLVRDSGAAGDEELRDYFSRRALIVAVVAGRGSGSRRHRPPPGRPLDLRRAHLVARHRPGRPVGHLGLAALGLLITGRYRVCSGRRRRGGREIRGYFSAVVPNMLPTSLKISDAAGVSATLTEVIIVFGVAAVTVVPSLILLYTLSQRSALE